MFSLLNEKRLVLFPFTKKGGKQTLENYRPVLLLPISWKIYERLQFNEMFNFFIENKHISWNESGFKSGDSRINQPLFITHEIYESFDVGFEIRSALLDISKAFDKRCHDGITYKLTQNGISGNLLNLLELFKGKKTTRSPQRTILCMEKCKCWSTSKFHPWSFLVLDLHYCPYRRPHY